MHNIDVRSTAADPLKKRQRLNAGSSKPIVMYACTGCHRTCVVLGIFWGSSFFWVKSFLWRVCNDRTFRR